jgi:hypothetical protein
LASVILNGPADAPAEIFAAREEPELQIDLELVGSFPPDTKIVGLAADRASALLVWFSEDNQTLGLASLD